MKKKNSKRWFVALRGSYIPRVWQGWLVYIPLIALAVSVLWVACNSDAGVLDAGLRALAELVAIGVLFHWIARQLV